MILTLFGSSNYGIQYSSLESLRSSAAKTRGSWIIHCIKTTQPGTSPNRQESCVFSLHSRLPGYVTMIVIGLSPLTGVEHLGCSYQPQHPGSQCHFFASTQYFKTQTMFEQLFRGGLQVQICSYPLNNFGAVLVLRSPLVSSMLSTPQPMKDDVVPPSTAQPHHLFSSLPGGLICVVFKAFQGRIINKGRQQVLKLSVQFLGPVCHLFFIMCTPNISAFNFNLMIIF